MHRLSPRVVRLLFIILMLIMLLYEKSSVYAAETTSDTDSTNTSTGETSSINWKDNLDKYNFSDIDEAVQQTSEYDVSFQQIITQIIGDDGSQSKVGNGLISTFHHIFTDFIKSNKTAVYQIIMLAVLSAGIQSLGASFHKNQVSDTAQMIISISLITILVAAFYVACGICSDAVSGCIRIYKALIPVFFSAVAFASGSTTSAVYYELVLIMITVVNMVFGSVLISLNKIYVLFTMADSVTSDEHFTKASEMIPEIIKWTCRTAIIIFTGLGGIKGMIAPMSDSLKKNMLYKALQMIPGIGNSVEMVSQTVIGAGTIVKNGIGTAAIVVLVIVCSIPLMKLILLTCLFKVTAAVIEPVSDKRIVKAVSGISVAIGSLAVIVLVTVSLFILMAAIICISTNYNYLA